MRQADEGREVRIRGTVWRVIYEDPQGSFAVVRLEDGTVVRGPLAGLKPGMPVLVIGRWRQHPRFGPQVEAHYFEVPQDFQDAEALVSFLAWTLKGIGKSRARLLAQHFGPKILEILDEDPERILEVPGIGPKTLEQVKRSWHRYATTRKTFLHLARLGLSYALARRVYEYFGDDAVRIVEEDPYRLAEVPRVGFRRADEIARKQGIRPEDPRRIRAALLYVLNRAAEEQGHVYLPLSELRDRLRALEIPSGEAVDAGLRRLAEEGLVVAEEARVYLRAFYEMEQRVAERLHALAAAPVAPIAPLQVAQALETFRRETGFQLSEEQGEAVARAARHPVFLLTGYAGTGKTTVTRAMLTVFRTAGLRVALAAPTGKAAHRLEEVTGHEASTIHRLLGFQGGTWNHDEDHPLPVDALIVDELSMVDLVLFDRLLAALRPGTRLFLVGDPAQLPAIGPGQVLRDLLASGRLPGRTLDHIFRQEHAGGIVINANRVRQGKPLKVREAPDFVFHEIQDTETHRVHELARDLARRYGHDFQYLTGMHRGSVGVRRMNPLIREVLNPHRTEELAGFATGDRVIQTRNNYDKAVFNGEVGRVVSVDPEEDRLVVHFGDGRLVAYSELEAEAELELAYALTVHKFQGSEAPVVLLPLVTEQYVMLHRNWLYTAMTRARKLLVLVGSRRAFWIALKNQKPIQRYTTLARRLQEVA